jgi:hypothetical protein
MRLAKLRRVANLSLVLNEQHMRAPRFPLQLSVRYRKIGDREWRRGETENVSRSGALIRMEAPLDVDASVELRVTLAVPTSGVDTAEVRCRARVVRSVSPSDHHEWPASAVAIEQYDFEPVPVSFSSAHVS